jgi:hypothetical protein
MRACVRVHARVRVRARVRVSVRVRARVRVCVRARVRVRASAGRTGPGFCTAARQLSAPQLLRAQPRSPANPARERSTPMKGGTQAPRPRGREQAHCNLPTRGGSGLTRSRGTAAPPRPRTPLAKLAAPPLRQRWPARNGSDMRLPSNGQHGASINSVARTGSAGPLCCRHVLRWPASASYAHTQARARTRGVNLRVPILCGCGRWPVCAWPVCAMRLAGLPEPEASAAGRTRRCMPPQTARRPACADTQSWRPQRCLSATSHAAHGAHADQHRR